MSERDGSPADERRPADRRDDAAATDEWDAPDRDRPERDDESVGIVEMLFGASGEEGPPRPSLERESPNPENALFVALGVLLALFVVYRIWSVAAV